MKKFKVLTAALAVCLGLGAFAACTDPEEPHTEHVDADGDGYCDVCNEKLEETVTPPEEYEITDGVFLAQADATHRILIKFYEDGSFYAEGMQGNAVKGVYEVKSESIQYRPSDDALLPVEDADFVTGDTVVYFWEADGTTPIRMNRNDPDGAQKNLYPEGTPGNAVAYADDALQAVTFDHQTRTLTHSPLNPFSESDEKAIEQYRFMLKNESDIPEGAEEDAAVQDYTMVLSQKGFETNILGSDAVGKYTVEGNVYTLTGTIPSGAYGTLTVSEDGKSATYVNGDTTLELVAYAEETESAVAEMTGTVSREMQGQQVEFTFTLSFYADHSGEVVAAAYGNEISAATFTWAMAENGMSVVVSEVSNGTLTDIKPTADYQNVEATWSGDVNAAFTGIEVTLSAPASALSALKEVPDEASVLKELTSSINVGIEVNFTLTFLSDGTASISASLMGNEFEVTADWVLSASGMPSVEFTNVSDGSVTFALADPVTFTWKGTLGAAGEQEVVFSMPASELADLQ